MSADHPGAHVFLGDTLESGSLYLVGFEALLRRRPFSVHLRVMRCCSRPPASSFATGIALPNSCSATGCRRWSVRHGGRQVG